jgi:circadian clock protein KaiB
MNAMSPQPRPRVSRRLLLFVAGGEPNSRIARSNLERLCATAAEPRPEVTVIDVLEDLAAALEHHILVTPTLLQLEPEPRVVVIGNLSDLEAVRDALGLQGVEEA